MQRLISSYQAAIGFPWRKYFPALFFLGGFVWDALTIGKQVQQSDFIILSSYLIASALILWWIAHHAQRENVNQADATILRVLPKTWREPAPYFLLQFLYGSLLSALFILYFKSAGHAYALVWSLVLASLLVGNEFLEHHYQKNTIAWTMFGFCAMLLFNFLLPCLVGSIHAAWFVLSTLAGAGLTHFFYKKSQQPLVHIAPTWILAGILLLAYFADVIPPVPLVKQDVAIGVALNKMNGNYSVQVDEHAWWQLWRLLSDEVRIKQGEKVYCVTAVFAPQGLRTRLYHRWEFSNGKTWQTTSRIGFALNGGRQAGFRGYTYKQNLQVGEWRVTVETEEEHTLSTDYFTLVKDNTSAEISRKDRVI